MNKILTSKKPTNIEWIVAGMIFFTFFCCYLYSDICLTTSSGLNVWSSLMDGKLMDFYSYHYPGVAGSYIPKGVTGGAYDIFIYFVFALYNFPLWIYEKVTGTSFLDIYFGRVYMKCILVVFTILAAIFIKKIVMLLTGNRNTSLWASFIFIFSELTISTIVVIGGYDIISVCFSLIGLYFYLKNDNRNFILFFAMAIACKLFAIWIFIPLVLLKQKKIIKVLADGLIGMSIVIIPKIILNIYHHFMSTEIVTGKLDNGVIAHANIISDKLFCGNSGPISFGNIPIFFAVTFVIWWISWKKKESTQYEIIFLCTISLCAMFLFADTIPYWAILLTPYLAIIITLNPKNIADNVLLEAIFSFGYLFYNVCMRRQCYGMNLIVYMLKPSVFPVISNDEYIDYGISLLIEKCSTIIGISKENILSLFLTCFSVGLFIFLYINRPKTDGNDCEVIINYRKYAWLRVLLSLIVAIFPLIGLTIYFVK